MTSIEFSGVEVKCGGPLKVEADDSVILHLSQAALGESKSGKDKESVPLFVKCDGQKLVLGTLSHENIPQLALHLVMEKEFELAHKSKNGSVYYTRYKCAVGEDKDTDEYSDFCSEDEDIPLAAAENGTKAYRKLQGKDMTKDTTLEFERKRNMPVRCNRDVVSDALTPIRTTAEMKQDREWALFSERCNAMAADIKANYKEIDAGLRDKGMEFLRKKNMLERSNRDVASDALKPIRNIAKKEQDREWALVSERCNAMAADIKANYKEIDAGLRDKGMEFLRKRNMRLDMRKLDSRMGNLNFKVTPPAQTSENQVMEE